VQKCEKSQIRTFIVVILFLSEGSKTHLILETNCTKL